MSFIVKPVSTIKEKVAIDVPQDMGKSQKSHIVVEYKKLPVSEAKTLLENAQAGELNDDDVLRDNIINIDGLLDESKAKIEYSTDVLEQLLEMEFVRKPLITKFMEVTVGREALQRKN